MNIRVRENISGKAENVMAFASVTFNGCFAVNDIAIIKNKDGGLFVSMPSYVSKTDENGGKEYQDICYPKKDFYKEFTEQVMAAYKKVAGAKDRDEENAEMPVEEPEQGEKTSREPGTLNFTVRVKPYDTGNSVKGFATVTLEDSFVIGKINLVEGKNGMFVSMPSSKYQDRNGEVQYKDICHPVTRDFREKLYGAILDGFEKERLKDEAEDKSEDKAENKTEFEGEVVGEPEAKAEGEKSERKSRKK